MLRRLTKAFQRYGYTGTSLASMSENTGLAKASLYYYFPGGKQDMAEQVLLDAIDQLNKNIIQPLKEPGDPREKLEDMAQMLIAHYRQGREPCIYVIMSLGESGGLFYDILAPAFNSWIQALAAVLEEADVPPKEARARAQDAIVALQGSVVLTNILQDTTPFMRNLTTMPDRLLIRCA